VPHLTLSLGVIPCQYRHKLYIVKNYIVWSTFLLQKVSVYLLRPPLGDLGATYDDHLRLIGKRVLDFPLFLIELFSLGVTAEELRVENRRFRSNGGRLTKNFT